VGFFLEDNHVARMTAKPVRAPRGQKAVASSAPGCDGCNMRARWPRMVTPKMALFKVSPDADILVVGDAPTPDADKAGLPFYGSYWGMLRKAVHPKHWERLCFQNVIRCTTGVAGDKPQDLRRPTPAEVHSCSGHLDADVHAVDPVCVLILGDVALRRMVPDCYNKTTAGDLSGTWLPITAGGRVVWGYVVLGLDVVHKFGGEGGPAWPVFQADIKNFFDTMEALPKPRIYDISPQQVHIVHTLAEATAFRDRMGKRVTVDVEATGLRPTARDELFLTNSFSDGVLTMAFSVDHPLGCNAWAKPFIAETIAKAERWCAHQAGMETAWLQHFCGVPFEPERLEDTQAMARILHNNENLLSLADQTRIHLGVNVKALSDLDVRNLIAYPIQDVLTYNGLDTLATAHVWDKHKHITLDVNYRRLVDATSMVTQMQMYGLPVDLNVSHALKEKWSAKAKAAEVKARKIYEVRQWEQNTQREWRITADQDTADALVRFGHVPLPKTDAGNYKTDEHLLLSLAPGNPLVLCVLDHREATKLVSTYIDCVIESCARHTDGLLHPCYTVTLTATGRLSAEDPNIQNFPRRFNVELRGQIVCPPGCIMVAFDYGQLEARLIAMASKDRFLIEAILTGYDIHAEWGPAICRIYPQFWNQMQAIAEETYGAPVTDKQIKKVMRDRIKNGFVFPSFYGSYVNSIADNNLNIPREIAQAVQKDFWSKFAGVKTWMEARRKEYQDTGSARTLTGRIRHTIMKGNEPINTPIQGTAADVVADAMNECAEIARREGDIYMHPRIQIHDDLTFFLPDDERLEGYIQRIFEVLGKRRYKWQTVPFLVEAKCGYSWETLEEFADYTGKHHA
jgi:uracil-DNA glycosylase family 4